MTDGPSAPALRDASTRTGAYALTGLLVGAVAGLVSPVTASALTLTSDGDLLSSSWAAAPGLVIAWLLFACFTVPVGLVAGALLGALVSLFRPVLAGASPRLRVLVLGSISAALSTTAMVLVGGFVLPWPGWVLPGVVFGALGPLLAERSAAARDRRRALAELDGDRASSWAVF